MADAVIYSGGARTYGRRELWFYTMIKDIIHRVIRTKPHNSFPNGSFHSFVMRLSLMLSAKQFMNPFLIFYEYTITPRAIKRCLGDMGFVDIRIFNSRLAGDDLFAVGGTFAKLPKKILSSLTWGFFKSLEKLSGGRWLWGPSLQVIARKGTGGRRP